MFVVYGTFCAIPTVESYGAGVFVPARTLIAVKLTRQHNKCTCFASRFDGHADQVVAIGAHERQLFNKLLW